MGSEWRRASIGSVCTRVTSGGTPRSGFGDYYDGGKIPWLNTKEIDFRSIWTTERNITEAGLAQSSANWVPAATVIVAMYGATAGKVALARTPLTTNQACCNLVVDETLADSRFVFYALWSKYPELAGLSNGAAQQNLSAATVKAFEINLPPLDEQRRIASVLGALDDKIELNRRMSRTLGEVIQRIFDSASQDVDGGSHSAGSLGDLLWLVRDPVHPEEVAAETPYVALEHFDGGSLVLERWGRASDATSGKSIFRRGDILFGKLRPYFHKVVVAPFDGICSTDIMVLRPKSPEWFGVSLGHVNSNEFIKDATARSDGTRMPRVGWTDVASYAVPIPPLSVAAELSSKVRSLVDRQRAASSESITLAAARLLACEVAVRRAHCLVASSSCHY
jgi:type I restriction enzyme S subunit